MILVGMGYVILIPFNVWTYIAHGDSPIACHTASFSNNINDLPILDLLKEF
jgi:hypothetical protein